MVARVAPAAQSALALAAAAEARVGLAALVVPEAPADLAGPSPTSMFCLSG